jgi:hypothetical protein
MIVTFLPTPGSTPGLTFQAVVAEANTGLFHRWGNWENGCVHESGGARDTWLDPLRVALDETAAPVTFFFRDDDAGWDDGRLFSLLDVFARRALPLDVAVIPRALSAERAARLLIGSRGWSIDT